uniref:TMF_TATA_bd domain-containing protein n=1 Tax=Gongylonema pulchrum TaxID=637853 RepID=A0A183E4L4_9BILA
LRETTVERDSAKKELDKLIQEAPSKELFTAVQKKLEKSEAERQEQSAKFEQLRQIARQYKVRTQTLQKDLEAVQAQLAEKFLDEGSATEIARLKGELVAARAEIEMHREQKMVPRVGRPTELTAGGSPSKATSAHLAQFKQTEGLNEENKNLKKQLEELTEQYEESQRRLAESTSKLAELEKSSNSKEELLFRLNSVLSMLNKKNQEIGRLRKEQGIGKQLLSESSGITAGAAPEGSTDRAAASDFDAALLADATVKPTSSTISILERGGSPEAVVPVVTEASVSRINETPKEEMPTSFRSMSSDESAVTLVATEKYLEQSVLEDRGEKPSTASVTTTGRRISAVGQSSDDGETTRANPSQRSDTDVPTPVQLIPSRIGLSSPRFPRKRTFRMQSDQSSSVEIGSDVLEPVKRTRGMKEFLAEDQVISLEQLVCVEQDSTAQHLPESGDTSYRDDRDSHVTDEIEQKQMGIAGAEIADDRALGGRAHETGTNTLGSIEVQERNAVMSIDTAEELCHREGRIDEEVEEDRDEREVLDGDEHEVLIDEEDSPGQKVLADETDFSDAAVEDSTGQEVLADENDLSDAAVGESTGQEVLADESDSSDAALEDSTGQEVLADENDFSDAAEDEMVGEEEEAGTDSFDEREFDEEEGEYDSPPSCRLPTFYQQQVIPPSFKESENDESDDDDVILVVDDNETDPSRSSVNPSVVESQEGDRGHQAVAGGIEGSEQQNVLRNDSGYLSSIVVPVLATDIGSDDITEQVLDVDDQADGNEVTDGEQDVSSGPCAHPDDETTAVGSSPSEGASERRRTLICHSDTDEPSSSRCTD